MKLRQVITWFHLGVALLTGAYFYSPLKELDWVIPLYQFLIIPLVGLSGVFLWKQGPITKFFKARKAK